MAGLKVPDRYKSGIFRLAQLPDEGFAELLAAVKKAPACKDSRELVAWIADETPGITSADRNSIIRAIVPMFRVQRNAKVSPKDFASDVWDGLGDIPSGIDRQAVLERTELLINEAALDLPSVRVADVKQEVERNFCKIRILTDLRPALTQESEESPVDMAFIHNLQIGYHDGGGKHHEFYVSLDGDDLNQLKTAIAEAESKAETLERLLKSSAIRLHR